jgi:hypothetical protein
MIRLRSIAISLSLTLGFMAAPDPASAFACTVNPPEGGSVLIRLRPDPKSKIVARLRPPAMVSDVSGVSWRGDWVYVRWSRAPLSQAEFSRGNSRGKGWVRIEETQGECED